MVSRRTVFKVLGGGVIAAITGTQIQPTTAAADIEFPGISDWLDQPPQGTLSFFDLDDLFSEVDAQPNTLIMSMNTKDKLEQALEEYQRYEQERWDMLMDGHAIVETFDTVYGNDDKTYTFNTPVTMTIELRTTTRAAYDFDVRYSDGTTDVLAVTNFDILTKNITPASLLSRAVEKSKEFYLFK